MSCSRLAGLRVAGYSAGRRLFEILLRYWRIWENLFDSIIEATCPAGTLRDIRESYAVGEKAEPYKVAAAFRCYQQHR